MNQAASVTQAKFESKKASITALSNLYESLLKDLGIRMPVITNKKLSNTIRYHWAIINSAERLDVAGDRLKGENKPCTTYAGFIHGNDPFICLEDIVIRIDTLKHRLNKMGKTFSELGIEEDIKRLREKGVEKITGKQFSIFIHDTKSNESKNGDSISDYHPPGWYPCDEGTTGATCGCCGQPGLDEPCSICAPLCLFHDMACTDCEIYGLPILCGEDCIAFPCVA